MAGQAAAAGGAAAAAAAAGKRGRGAEGVEGGGGKRLRGAGGAGGAAVPGAAASPETEERTVAANPYGVRPGGDGCGRADGCRAGGLGPRLGALDDRVVLDVLSFACAGTLAALSCTSRALYVFASQDELWKQLVVGRFGGAFRHRGAWRDTWTAAIARKSDPEAEAPPRHRPLRVDGFYSDYLFAGWMAAHASLGRGVTERDNIDRRRADGLDVAEFERSWERRGRPLLLEGAASAWPAVRDGEWSREELLRRYGDTVFEAREVDMRLRDFYEYSDEQRDDAPLYVFDKRFGERAPGMVPGYEVPPYFRADLFRTVGEADRPDYRWLLIGPRHSGSTMHKDPNHTSAWNACVSGVKKWIFFPPGARPPGISTDADEAEITVPLSVAEWFLNFYDDAQELKPIECVQRPGDVVFVPSGWWHSVYNITDSVAVTQNYVSPANLTHVLRFLRDKRDQVSGCHGGVPGERLYEALRNGLAREHPGLLRNFDEAEERIQRQRSLWTRNGGGASAPAAPSAPGGFQLTFG